MKRRFTEDSWRKEPWFQTLCTALRSCRTDDDMANFLRDIATLSELQALSERLEVARLLGKGLSYRQISTQTGTSTTTVTRVAHFLENGEGGYRRFLNVHRHHRMAKKHGASAQLSTDEAPADPTVRQERPAPVSVLQKYLDR